MYIFTFLSLLTPSLVFAQDQVKDASYYQDLYDLLNEYSSPDYRDGVKIISNPKQLKKITYLNISIVSEKILESPLNGVEELVNVKKLSFIEHKSCRFVYSNFKVLPDWMQKLNQLEELNIHLKGLKVLPDWLKNFKSLKKLQLHSSSLISIEAIKNMSQLQELDLRIKDLNALPVNYFKDFTELKKLKLYSYPLISIDFIESLTQLEELDISYNKLEVLPAWLKNFTALKKLNLSHSKKFSNISIETELELIESFLSPIKNLRSLESLLMAHNDWRIIPGWLKNFTSLKELNLEDNLLTSIEPIKDLIQLEELNVSRNMLTVFPEWIGNLKKLRVLEVGSKYHDCGGYGLVSMPDSIKNLVELEKLSLEGDNNKISIPDWIGQLTKLQDLELVGFYLNNFPADFKQLTQLRRLNLSRSIFDATSILEIIGSLENLEELNFSYLNLIGIPEWIGNLTNLKKLNLSNNRIRSFKVGRIRSIPNSLAKLKKLEYLNLSSNRLKSFPEISKFKTVKCLYLSYNLLETLDNSIGTLKNLTHLYLSNNRLTFLPDDIGKLKNLTTLYLMNNQLASIPANIGNLINLKFLSIEKNSFSIPDSLVVIGKLTNLVWLSLSGLHSIIELPDCFGDLKLLETIDLPYGLRSAPPSLKKHPAFLSNSTYVNYWGEHTSRDN